MKFVYILDAQSFQLKYGCCQLTSLNFRNRSFGHFFELCFRVQSEIFYNFLLPVSSKLPYLYAFPGLILPALPALCSADAFEITTLINDSTP